MVYKCMISHMFLLTFGILVVRIKLLEADPGVKTHKNKRVCKKKKKKKKKVTYYRASRDTRDRNLKEGTQT